MFVASKSSGQKSFPLSIPISVSLFGCIPLIPFSQILVNDGAGKIEDAGLKERAQVLGYLWRNIKALRLPGLKSPFKPVIYGNIFIKPYSGVYDP